MSPRKIKVRGIEFNVNDEVPTWPEFWDHVENGTWEPEAFKIMDKLGPGWRWIDIGAWIGPTVLYAAARGAMVRAYEPDHVAFDRLQANVALNPQLVGQIQLNKCALGNHDGTLVMSTERLGDSMLSAFSEDRHQVRGVEVLVRDARNELLGLPFGNRTIIKMDTEGSEYKIMPHIDDLLTRTQWSWYVSLHPWVVTEREHNDVVAMFRDNLDPSRYYLVWTDHPRDPVGHARGTLVW